MEFDIRFVIEIGSIVLTGSGIYWNLRLKLKELELRVKAMEAMEAKFSEDFCKLEGKLDTIVSRIEQVATRLEVMTERVNNLMKQ